MSAHHLPRLLLGCLLTGLASADFVVNPAEPITHFVRVQPVIVEKSNGTEAEFMGNASTEAYIKNRIGQAWAQVGVEIEWLPPTSYTSNFAYDGSPGNYSSSSRPQSHLRDIVDAAGTPPKSSDAIELNMFFVEVVPGFSALPDNYANGLAFIDDNGSAIHVGSTLLTWDAGRDLVASVIAHEIGHNLGLYHYDTTNDNLMNSGSGTAEKLTSDQKSTIFDDKFWRIDSYEYLQSVGSESNYGEWAGLFGVSADPEDDDDGDRLSNGFEFLYGSAPDSPTPFPAPNRTAAGPVWTLPKSAEAVEDGFDYEVHTSPTLDGWLPAGDTGSGSTLLTDNSSEVSVRLDHGAPSAFLRVEVNPPPAAGVSSLTPPASAALVAPVEDERIYSSCHLTGCGCRHSLEPPTDD